MSIKETILKDVNAIENPLLLMQCFEYIQSIKKLELLSSNRTHVLKFAGLLTDKQTKSMIKSIDDNFSTIEGEW